MGTRWYEFITMEVKKLAAMWNKKISFKRPQTLAEWKAIFSNHPVTSICCCGILLVILMYCFAAEQKSKLSPIPKQEKPEIVGIKEAIDPRAAWSDIITKDVKALKDDMQQTVNQQQATIQEEIKQLTEKINALKTTLDNLQYENQKPSHLAEKEPPKELVNKAPKVMGFVHRDYDDSHKKQPDSYVTSSSFARAVLLTGVVADTGTDAAGSPQPILLRLVDEGIFSKGYKTKQVKEAIIIGACYGNISSERASCRLEKLSLMNQDNHIVERPVEGWLIGEDGRPGLKGDIVDKSSDVARMAVLNGILGGIASFFQNQASAGMYPISPITGQNKPVLGMDALKAGSASGVGNALQKLADYAIKRAEQMSPVIVVASGRVVDVVFKSGFELKDLTPINGLIKSGTSFGGNKTNHVSSGEQLNVNDKKGVMSGYKDGIKSLNDLQLGEGDF